MADAPDESLERIECDVLEARCGARVAIRRGMRRAYDALTDQKKGRLVAIMQGWCEGRRLTSQMFNGNEGRTPRHDILLQAFKTFKVRLYGFSSSIGDRRTFVIVDADPAKKQDRADPKILKRAKRRVDDLLDEFEGE
jgi:hypothetical protein